MGRSRNRKQGFYDQKSIMIFALWSEPFKYRMLLENYKIPCHFRNLTFLIDFFKAENTDKHNNSVWLKIFDYNRTILNMFLPISTSFLFQSDDAINHDRLYDLVAVVVHCGRSVPYAHPCLSSPMELFSSLWMKILKAQWG